MCLKILLAYPQKLDSVAQTWSCEVEHVGGFGHIATTHLENLANALTLIGLQLGFEWDDILASDAAVFERNLQMMARGAFKLWFFMFAGLSLESLVKIGGQGFAGNDPFFAKQNQAALNEVFKFAHIAWPVVA